MPAVAAEVMQEEGEVCGTHKGDLTIFEGHASSGVGEICGNKFVQITFDSSENPELGDGMEVGAGKCIP